MKCMENLTVEYVKVSEIHHRKSEWLDHMMTLSALHFARQFRFVVFVAVQKVYSKMSSSREGQKSARYLIIDSSKMLSLQF